MTKVLGFIKRERLYVLLAIFIIFVNVLAAISDKGGIKDKKAIRSSGATLEEKLGEEVKGSIFMKQEEVAKILSEKKSLTVLFGLASLLIFAVLTLGIMIDALLVSIRFAKKNLEIQTYEARKIRWDIRDVARVVILFLFFGYILIIIESFLISLFPILKDDNFRMILNSSVLDILTIIFIIYFTVDKHKEHLAALGLSFKNFLKNVFYGIVGYVAAVPVLVSVVMFVAFIVNITKYVPEQQPLVELFLKEKNVTFLAYTSVFTAIVGPFVEELFFRGFMYNAVKKAIGIFWATVLTASIFATLHTNIVGFLPIMALGVVLAYLYEKTGTIVSSITVHMIHNLSMVFLVFLVKQLKG